MNPQSPGELHLVARLGDTRTLCGLDTDEVCFATRPGHRHVALRGMCPDCLLIDASLSTG